MNNGAKVNNYKENNNKYYMSYKEYMKALIATEIFLDGYVNRKYDYIYGVPRGGLIPATYLSHKLEIPIIISLDNNYIPKRKGPISLLIVEDIIDSGETINKIIKKLDIKINEGIIDRYDIVSIVTRAKNKDIPIYTYRVQKNNDWIIFPYEKH